MVEAILEGVEKTRVGGKPLLPLLWADAEPFG